MEVNQARAGGAAFIKCVCTIVAVCGANLFPAFAQTDSQNFAANDVVWKELAAPKKEASEGKAATSAASNEPNSIFAVVTQKAGLASALAHNHFIVAKDYELVVQPGTLPLQPAKVTVKFEVKKLSVDPYELSEGMAPRLLSLGLSHAKFSKLSESDRKTIADHMLAEDQLNGSKFPVIEAEASGFRPKTAKLGSQDSNYEADFVFKIRDKVVKKQIPLLISQSETQVNGVLLNLIKIEGLVSERFQNFGFNAYSGLLGTVKNKDEFHFYFKSEGTWVKK